MLTHRQHERVAEIFIETIALPRHLQRDYVSRLTTEDDAVLEEVLSLLDHDESTGADPSDAISSSEVQTLVDITSSEDAEPTPASRKSNQSTWNRDRVGGWEYLGIIYYVSATIYLILLTFAIDRQLRLGNLAPSDSQSVRIHLGLINLIALFPGVALGFFFVRRQRQPVRVASIGSYRRMRRIGEGGMSMVYRAEHTQLRRVDAIKIVRQQGLDLRARRWFDREVRLASSLTHPHTIRIYDYGQADPDTFYCAMEYVEGITLQELVSETGPLPVPRALGILRQTAAALVEAHESGIAHRDIKPGNVMICRRGGICDFVKVLDFGLAMKVDSLDTSDRSTVVGTVEYMPPERFTHGRPLLRSDLYSFGALAYFLLSGQTLYRDVTGPELMRKIASEPVPPLGDVATQEIPSALVDLVMHCVEKVPIDRPESMDRVQAALEALAVEYPWGKQQALESWLDGPAVLKGLASRTSTITPG